jgi:two-component system sensor histidine kinase/response regulator
MEPRILIVDDDPMNRELLHAVLCGDGYALDHASSGADAVELARARPPDLVLLDVMMPHLDGFETTRLLKQLAAPTHLPVILITALSDHKTLLRGLQAGADEVLSKPIDGLELRVRITNLLALRAERLALAERQAELLRANTELARAHASLVELQRFKDELSLLIIHDLKGPLTVVTANLGFAIESNLPPGVPVTPTLEEDQIVEALLDARAAAFRLQRIANSLLDVAKIEAQRFALKREEVDVLHLLDELRRVRGFEARAIAVDLQIDAQGDQRVSIDSTVITRALENILDNALRYTPPQGRIVLESRQANGHLQFRIGNTGPPIPVEKRALIFEKFGQVQGERRNNYGLGLYFCRLAAEAHGGRVWIDEEPDLPTVFVLDLPSA